MAEYKLHAYVLSFLTFLVVCKATQYEFNPPSSNQPRVLIVKVDNMSPSQQADAADFLKSVFGSNYNDTCKNLKDRFAQKYKDEDWNVVLFKAHSINALKSIELKVGDDHYLLFATKNGVTK